MIVSLRRISSAVFALGRRFWFLRVLCAFAGDYFPQRRKARKEERNGENAGVVFGMSRAADLPVFPDSAEMECVKDLINIFDQRFAAIHDRSVEMVHVIPEENLFAKDQSPALASFGESVLRSAGKIEQTFGGITTRLWDDPFEWTLPEELSSPKKILEYLDEVEETRKNGFGFFSSDADLNKELPAPEKMTSIFSLLLDTVVIAERYQERACCIASLFDKRNQKS